jgi:hypothetical protein
VQPHDLAVCSTSGWWSAFGKKRGKNGKEPGRPVHDDRVQRSFTLLSRTSCGWPTSPNTTAEGKLYLCAIKDLYSNRVVGNSISDRMKARLALNALTSAVARRDDVTGCILRTDPRTWSVPQQEVRPRPEPPRDGRLDGQGWRRRRQRRQGIVLRAAPEERPGPPDLGHPARAADRDRQPTAS